MKKIMILILLMISMVGCAGASDYNITLINNYEVVRTSGEHVFIAKRESEYSWSKQLIPAYYDGIFEEEHPEYVVEVAHDKSKYILVKTNEELYYILDTKTENVYGGFVYNEFDEKKKELEILEDIELKNLNDYKKDK